MLPFSPSGGPAQHLKILALCQGSTAQFISKTPDCSYTVDGETYSQSNAIVRHLARKHGLYGASEHEALRIDAFLDGIDDIRRKYFMVVYVGMMQPSGLETYWDKLCDPKSIAGFNGGAHFEFINRLFKKASGSQGFAVGNQLTIAGKL